MGQSTLQAKLEAMKVMKKENFEDNLDIETTEEESAEVNDYESYDPIPNERRIIVRTLGDIILGGGDIVIEIINPDGSVREDTTKLVNDGIKSTNFLQTFQLGFEKALIDNHAALRISGDITNPVLYLARSFVGTWDLADNRKIKRLQAMFMINDGVEQNALVQERYSKHSGVLKSVLSSGITKLFNIESTLKVPYIILIPNKDINSGRARSIFQDVEEREEFYTATFNKKMIYAKDVNYHLLPDKAVLADANETETWKTKLKNLLIFRKDKMSRDENQGESIEKIEPNMDFFIKVISSNDEAGKSYSDALGIQNPSFQGTKQMSEHEIKVLKQKEEITIRKYKKMLESALKHILSFYILNDNFEVNINNYETLTKNEIDNRKLDAELAAAEGEGEN